MTRRTLAAILAAVAIPLAACEETTETAAAGGTSSANAAPYWSLTSASGESRSLGDYKGELVLMDFWAVWCGPCRQVMPAMQRLHETYGERGLNVVGINTWEKASNNPVDFMKSNGYTYELLLNGDGVAEAYGVEGIPTFVLIGPDGELLHRAVGASRQNEQQLEQIIESHLAG